MTDGNEHVHGPVHGRVHLHAIPPPRQRRRSIRVFDALES